jgi:AhpD family alkylhydroperoxidase
MRAAKREEVMMSTRLQPIDRSWNPLFWVALLAYRVAVGGAATPARVIFARAPGLVIAHLMLMMTSEYALSLDRRVRHLVRVYGSRVNGCMYCDDLETYVALRQRAIARDDVDALPRYAESERFSARERAALRYVEEINTTRNAGDETFAALRQHFSERQIVELTWLNAVGNYLNLQARPLGLGAEGYCALPQHR